MQQDKYELKRIIKGIQGVNPGLLSLCFLHIRKQRLLSLEVIFEVNKTESQFLIPKCIGYLEFPEDLMEQSNAKKQDLQP